MRPLGVSAQEFSPMPSASGCDAQCVPLATVERYRKLTPSVETTATIALLRPGGRPVRNDTAGTLGRMQPGHRQYRGSFTDQAGVRDPEEPAVVELDHAPEGVGRPAAGVGRQALKGEVGARRRKDGPALALPLCEHDLAPRVGPGRAAAEVSVDPRRAVRVDETGVGAGQDQDFARAAVGQQEVHVQPAAMLWAAASLRVAGVELGEACGRGAVAGGEGPRGGGGG